MSNEVTVAQLIEHLQTLPGDAIVVVPYANNVEYYDTISLAGTNVGRFDAEESNFDYDGKPTKKKPQAILLRGLG